MDASLGIFASFGTILLIAVVASLIARRFHIPPVVLYIVCGLVLGRYIPWIHLNARELQAASDIGVALLLFTIGIELPLTRVVQKGREVLSLGFMQFFGITLLLFIPCLFLFKAPLVSILVAATLSFSSTAVVGKRISDRGEESSATGDLTIGILLVQDLISIVLISILAATSILTFATVLVIFLCALLILRRLPFLTALKLEESTQLTFALLFLCFWVFSQMKLPLTTAGFLLGVLMGTRIEHMALFSQIRTLRDILLVVFFFMLGASVSAISLSLVLGAILIAILVMVVKFTLTTFFVVIQKLHPKHAFSVGFDLMQCGEFGFILLLLLFRTGMMTAYQKDVLLLSIMVTLILYVLSDTYREKFYQFLRKYVPFHVWSRMASERMTDVNEVPMENHIVLCGYGRVGSYIGHTLYLSGIPLVVIDTDVHHVQSLLQKGIKAFYGDAEEIEILRRADVSTARFVIVAVPDHIEQENIILLVKRLNPKAIIVARSHLQRNIRHLRALGIEYIVQPEFEASLTILKRILKLYKQSHDDIKKHIHYLKIEHGMGEE